MTTNSNSQTKGPIFVVGAARSGTTLLQYMLRSHPNISIPTAESHFFIPFHRRKQEFGDLTKKENIRSLLQQIYNAKKPFFDNDCHDFKFNADEMSEKFFLEKRSTVPEIISGIFEENARGEQKTRWADKTPYYILNLQTILEMFPDAQIVHLIRDGRDCCLSMLERKHDLKIYNTYHAAYIWNRYVTAGKAFGASFPDQYHEIKYENILNSPENTIKNLCKFLGEEFNQSIIHFKKSKGPGIKTPLLKSPLRKSNQNKWRDRMSKQQIRIFEAVAGKTLSQTGYALSTESSFLSPFDWIRSEIHMRFHQKWDKHFRN